MSKKVSSNVKHVREQVRACIFKFYPEMFGIEVSNEIQLKQATDEMKKFISAVVNDINCPYQIHAIVHDSDRCVPEIKKPKKEATDEERKKYKQEIEKYFWNPLLEKAHLHVLCITKSGCPVNIDTILNYFASKGLKIRRDEDTNGLMHGWIQKINMKQKRHISMMVYHTHETDEARAEGKHLYDRSEVYTNIGMNILEMWYQEYFVCISKMVSNSEYDYVVIKSKQLGLDIGKMNTKSFDEYWLEDVPYCIHKKNNLQALARQHYDLGVSKFLKSEESITNVRCCVFIDGSADTGKTTTSKLALQKMGFTPFFVESGKTGKFDDLKPSNKSIVVSDTSFGDIHAMTDNSFCRAYKRGSKNPVWTGQYLIVTYNGSLDKYISDNYSNATWFNNPESVEAIKSRFYQAKMMPDGKLHVYVPSLRGSDEDIYKRNLMCLSFKMAFNEMISGYVPKTDKHRAELKKEFLEMMGEKVPAPVPASAPASAPVPVPAPVPASGSAVSQELLDRPATFSQFLDDFVQLPF